MQEPKAEPSAETPAKSVRVCQNCDDDFDKCACPRGFAPAETPAVAESGEQYLSCGMECDHDGNLCPDRLKAKLRDALAKIERLEQERQEMRGKLEKAYELIPLALADDEQARDAGNSILLLKEVLAAIPQKEK